METVTFAVKFIGDGGNRDKVVMDKKTAAVFLNDWWNGTDRKSYACRVNDIEVSWSINHAHIASIEQS